MKGKKIPKTEIKNSLQEQSDGIVFVDTNILKPEAVWVNGKYTLPGIFINKETAMEFINAKNFTSRF